LRLGLVIYGSLDTVSGGYLYDRRLVASLRSHSAEVEVISLPWRDYLRCLGDNFSASLLRRLADLQVDVLLQDELNHPSLFWLNQRLHGRDRGSPCPIVSIVHHLRCNETLPSWESRLIRRIERSYLRSVDAFIYNSQATRRTVETVRAISTQCPYVVAYPAGDRFAPAITDEAISQRALQPGPLRLLFVGNVIPRKGLHTLLQALRTLPQEAWRLTVAGSLDLDPDYVRALRRQADEAGLAGRISFLGSLPDPELAHLLCSHQLLAVPSSYEGYGIVYLEGMGFGLPAIATTGGGAAEIVTHGRDGFLVSPDNMGKLAHHIGELWRNRQELRHMSLAARQRYLRHPTWEQTGEQIYAFLLNLAERRK
jgi:glycosyltransferase involved in cell wall biosynthesis